MYRSGELKWKMENHQLNELRNKMIDIFSASWLPSITSYPDIPNSSSSYDSFPVIQNNQKDSSNSPLPYPDISNHSSSSYDSFPGIQDNQKDTSNSSSHDLFPVIENNPTSSSNLPIQSGYFIFHSLAFFFFKKITLNIFLKN